METTHSNSKPQIEEIHRRFPGTWDRIYLSGFSLGGNVIVKFLGEQVRGRHQRSLIALFKIKIRESKKGPPPIRDGAPS